MSSISLLEEGLLLKDALAFGRPWNLPHNIYFHESLEVQQAAQSQRSAKASCTAPSGYSNY